jgi:hypothetical protein
VASSGTNIVDSTGNNAKPHPDRTEITQHRHSIEATFNHCLLSGPFRPPCACPPFLSTCLAQVVKVVRSSAPVCRVNKQRDVECAQKRIALDMKRIFLLPVLFLLVTASCAKAETYTTTFPSDENTLSGGGRWINGLTTGSTGCLFAQPLVSRLEFRQGPVVLPANLDSQGLVF